MFVPRYCAPAKTVVAPIPVASQETVLTVNPFAEKAVGVLDPIPIASTKFVNAPVGKVIAGPILIATGR